MFKRKKNALEYKKMVDSRKERDEELFLEDYFADEIEDPEDEDYIPDDAMAAEAVEAPEEIHSKEEKKGTAKLEEDPWLKVKEFPKEDDFDYDGDGDDDFDYDIDDES